MTIATTGIAGSGKTTFSEALASALEADLLNTDTIAHHLLNSDREVQSEIRSAFGEAVLSEKGAVDRTALARTVFSDDKARKRLEQILHPRIRSAWTSRCRAAASENLHAVVEIPLLFEVGAESDVDATVAVLASREVATRRLARRGWTPDRIERVFATQWSAHKKADRADMVAWNDGSKPSLLRQVDETAARLRSTFHS